MEAEKRLAVGIAIGLAGIYFLIHPEYRRKKRMKRFFSGYFAHRGLHKNGSAYPENSLPAFLLAVEHGYGIEMDVQLTKDNKAVVFHDFDLKRACGEKKKVDELNYEELKAYKLFGSSEIIPEFKDVLRAVDGRTPLIIEIKAKWKVEKVCRKVMECLKDYKGSYVVESFQPMVLFWLRRHAPEVLRGQLSSDFIKDKERGNVLALLLATHLFGNFVSRPDFIAYNHRDKNGIFFQFCQRVLNTPTAAWTIHSRKEWRRNKGRFSTMIFEGFHPDGHKIKKKEVCDGKGKIIEESQGGSC